MFRRILPLAILVVVAAGLAACPSMGTRGAPPRDTLVQYGTLQALLLGQYDGDARADDFCRPGMLGLGTFQGLDGEMVVLNGVAYRVGFDGVVTPMPPDSLTPFMCVAAFRPEGACTIASGLDYAGLQARLDECLRSPNLFHAIRIDGTFPYLKTRSVPKQQRPYPPLVDVIAEQAEFTFEDVSGTLIGFYSPPYAGDFNAVGYHFHFLNDARDAGGHVLAIETGVHEAQIDALTRYEVTFPETVDFLGADLTEDGGEYQ